jgi:eukaryotic-like serine/threonine-protein kinase
VAAAAPSTIAVPPVVGNTATAAKSKLENAGFRVISDTAPSDTAPVGNVIDQTPPANEQVAPGSTITITVSSGPASSTVPAPPPSSTSPGQSKDKGNGHGRGPKG